MFNNEVPAITGIRGMNTQNVFIKSLLITNTGTYEDMVLRPYTSRIDIYQLEALADRVQEKGRVDNAFIASNLPGYLQRSAESQGTIPIINTWSEPRSRYFMEVVTKDRFSGGDVITYIQGYTDYLGFTANNIDPNMTFYVNSITSANTGNGIRITDNSHILGGSGFREQDSLQIATPYEVVSTLNVSLAANALNASGYDLRSGITGFEAKSAQRTYDVPSAFIGSLANAFGSTHNGIHSPESDYYSNVTSYLDQSEVINNPFLRLLSNNRPGYSGGVSTFNFNSLIEIDPNVVNVVRISTTSNNYYSGQMSHMLGSDRTTQVAYSLMSSVPSIMTSLLLTKLAFSSTNNTIGGQILTTIIDANSPGNTVTPMILETFVKRLELEVIRDITFNNQVSYELNMRVDVLGETYISINIDGMGRYDYTMPTFADGLLSPVIVKDRSVIDNLATGIDMISEAISGSYMSANIAKDAKANQAKAFNTIFNSNSVVSFY